MATTTTTPTASATRLADIASQIANTCASIDSALTDLDAAKAAKDTATTNATSKREEIMSTVADLATQGAWTKGEIAAAAKLAIKRHNNLNTEKAMATFIGEVKRAAHPDVRDHFKALVSIRDTAWQAETEELAIDKASPAPLRKCFKRSYHALISAMAACEEGNMFQTCDDIVTYAKVHDPDHDADKVAKRLAAIHAQLAAFYVDFPVEDIGFCVDTIATITKDELTKARAKRLSDQAPTFTIIGNTPAAPTTTVVAAPVPEVAPLDPVKLAKAFTSTTTTVVVAPAPEIDIIDDILGDNLQLASAAD
jgi:hypothetical protein